MRLTYRGDLVATGAEVTAACGAVEVCSNVSVGALGKFQARVGIALQAGLAASFCSPCKQIQGKTGLLEDIDKSMLLLTRELKNLYLFLKGYPKCAEEACLQSAHWYPCSHKAACVQGRQWTVAMPVHHRPLMRVRVQIGKSVREGH